MNHKRIYRLYRLEGLSVRTKREAEVARSADGAAAPTRPNERWSMDFVSDVTESGRRFRVFADRRRLQPSLRRPGGRHLVLGARVSRILEEVGSLHPLPEMVVTDNGPEFTSKALDQWAYQRKVGFTSSDRASRWRTRTSRASTGSSVTSASTATGSRAFSTPRRSIEIWRADYNQVRPHSSLDGQSPQEYEQSFNQRGLPLQVA